ncbi:MAG: acylphosphatase [Chloroflexia bacterium]
MSIPTDNYAQDTIATLDATVTGRVQGVGFRMFVLAEGRRLGLAGTVQNRRDGSVHVVAHGARPTLEILLAALRRGPLGARVEHVDVVWAQRAIADRPPARFEVLF